MPLAEFDIVYYNVLSFFPKSIEIDKPHNYQAIKLHQISITAQIPIM